jgi:hypothetical protein
MMLEWVRIPSRKPMCSSGAVSRRSRIGGECCFGAWHCPADHGSARSSVLEPGTVPPIMDRRGALSWSLALSRRSWIGGELCPGAWHCPADHGSAGSAALEPLPVPPITDRRGALSWSLALSRQSRIDGERCFGGCPCPTPPITDRRGALSWTLSWPCTLSLAGQDKGWPTGQCRTGPGHDQGRTGSDWVKY